MQRLLSKCLIFKIRQLLLNKNSRVSGQRTLWKQKQRLPHYWHRGAIQVGSQHFLKTLRTGYRSTLKYQKYHLINQLIPKFSKIVLAVIRPATSSLSFQLEKTFSLGYGKPLSLTTTHIKPSYRALLNAALPQSIASISAAGSVATAIVYTNPFPFAPCSWNSSFPWS